MTGRLEMIDRSFFGRRVMSLVALLAASMLVLSACGVADEEAVDNTVVMARADWDTGYMQAAIYAQLIEELGYTVTDPAERTLPPVQLYPSLSLGQVHLWANGWFPLHDVYLSEEVLTGQSVDQPIEPVGWQVASGAEQGYLIDKATADELNISSISDLADPAKAAAFDSDGNGKANLIGCNKGWACNTVIDEEIAGSNWGANVEQVTGDYSDLIRGVVSKVENGEPVLFYTWTPNWTIDVMKPGEDIVWLESDWEVNSIRAVAFTPFLDENPQIRKLLEDVVIPLADIATQNSKMAGSDGYSEAQIQQDAANWIAANRGVVDSWLAAARAAG